MEEHHGIRFSEFLASWGELIVCLSLPDLVEVSGIVRCKGPFDSTNGSRLLKEPVDLVLKYYWPLASTMKFNRFEAPV